MDRKTRNKSINQNPWAGLAAYQDPETTDIQLKFCGRKNDSFDVADLIDNNIFVTLYGKSGTGKTSLLNAGVFPLLMLYHELMKKWRRNTYGTILAVHAS